MISNFSRFAKIVLGLWAALFVSPVLAQNLSGYVREAGSMEPLIGVTIHDSLSNARCLSNEFGYFSLHIAVQQPAVIKAAYPGYAAHRLIISEGTPDTSHTILLIPNTLQTVEISAIKKTAPPIGVLSIGRDKLLQTPSIGGIPDLLKVLATLPGVSNGGEVFTGLLVRGGNDDQNLHLLDGAPVYGTTHLFNLVSLYNAEAIKTATLHKGYFPARFGGRVASVLDVHFREGSKEKIQGNWSLGILNASFLLEGPMGKSKKSSFLLASRATYLDLLTWKKRKAVSRQENGSDTYNNFGFYDVNARFNHEFDSKNKLFLNVYYGSDQQKNIDQNIFVGLFSNHFADIQTTNQRLENLSVCARFSQIKSDRVFAHHTLSFNQYKNSIRNIERNYLSRDSFFYGDIVSDEQLKSQSQSNRFFIGENLSGRTEWVYTLNTQHQLRAGWEGILHRLQPGAFVLEQQEKAEDGTPIFASNLAFGNPSKVHFETAAYLEDEIRLLNQRLLLHPGIRVSYFSSSHQHTIDPRFAAEYTLHGGGRIAAAIGQTSQFLHTLNGDANRIDKSIWVGSSANTPAQRARIVTLGYSKYLQPLRSSFSIELFHRKMRELTSFRFNPDDEQTYANWETKLLGNGKGESYGADFLWNTTRQNFSLTTAYSLSWNNRKFPLLNNGTWFPAKYDRRHDLKITSSFSPSNSAWSFGATWFFNTGHRYTIPVGTVVNTPILGGFPAYEGINNVQMPAYHRLDLMAKWTRTPAKGWLKEYAWCFDILNAYNQKNPYGLVPKTITQIGPNGQPVTVKKLSGVSLLPILPSITFRAKF